MTSDPNPPGSERRRHRRFTPRHVHSLLGEVLDLSASGMRVRCRGKAMVELGETFDLLLQHQSASEDNPPHAPQDSDPELDIVARVRVVWIKRGDGPHHHIGLEVTEPTAQLEQSLLALDPQYQPNGKAPPHAFVMR